MRLFLKQTDVVLEILKILGIYWFGYIAGFSCSSEEFSLLRYDCSTFQTLVVLNLVSQVHCETEKKTQMRVQVWQILENPLIIRDAKNGLHCQIS